MQAIAERECLLGVRRRLAGRSHAANRHKHHEQQLEEIRKRFPSHSPTIGTKPEQLEATGHGEEGNPTQAAGVGTGFAWNCQSQKNLDIESRTIGNCAIGSH
jgi:hypothetical protein